MALPFRLCLALLRLLSLLSPATSRVPERQQSANCIRALSDAIPNQGIDVPTSPSTDLENIDTDFRAHRALRSHGTQLRVLGLARLSEAGLGEQAQMYGGRGQSRK